jgi:hypothetical protein
MKKINIGLLVIAAITSIVFLFTVESFNNLTLDDIGFALQLQKESIWNFIWRTYLTWQGRFMGFLITGLQIKSYFLFKSMIPFSILLYILNIFLVSKSLMNFFKIKLRNSLLYSIIFFQLYVYSMFDISSYFWLCTKGYTLIITLSLFAFSELVVNKRMEWYNYIILFITFAFLGCSYEIYAPLILLFLVCGLLYKLIRSNYNIKAFFYENKKLIFSTTVCILFFSLMVIAPGNWIRMEVHAKEPDLLFSDFLITAGKMSFHLINLLFLKIHYFLVAGFLLWSIYQQLNSSYKQNIRKAVSLKRILVYIFISVGLCLVSVLLNTYVVGGRIALRAFNHINLICFIFIGFLLYEFSSTGLHKKFMTYTLFLSLLFVIVCNIYCSFKNVPELRAYSKSVNTRMEKLERLRIIGNSENIKLSSLHVAEFHSVDDFWKLIVPKFTPPAILKPNEVSNYAGNHYNKMFRKYYKLDFDVITDLSFDL